MGRLPFRIEDIRGRQLPKEWAERAGIGPDDVVSVTIGPSREEALSQLRAVMDKIGQDAAARGLTPEKLREIVPDFPPELAKE